MNPAFSSDLEISIWKSTKRKRAEECFHIILNGATPNEKSDAVNEIKRCLADVGELALTRETARALKKLGLIPAIGTFEKEISGLTLNPFREKPQTNPQNLNPNKIADSILTKQKIVFLNDEFLQYDGGVYVKRSQTEIDALIKSEVSESFRSHLASEVRNSLATITRKSPEDFDQNPDILNCRNGLLNLKTMTLEPHSPEYFSLSQIEAAFLEGVPECPKWKKFLEEILGDDPFKIDVLQEYLGYCLAPSTRHEKILFLVGTGANGKSVVLDILKGLLGSENISSISLEQIRNSHYAARLFGKMVNSSYETETKAEVYEGQLKALISGEEIEADHKFGHPFKFRNKAKFVFALNSLPRVNDKTDAFYRRLLILPFNVTVSEESRNLNLAREILEAERDAIFKWSLFGLQRVQTEGFTKSQQMQDTIAQYRLENNSVLAFVRDKCMVEAIATITKAELYTGYKEFCDETGLQPLSEIKFGKQLKEQFRSVCDGRGIGGAYLWNGLKLC